MTLGTGRGDRVRRHGEPARRRTAGRTGSPPGAAGRAALAHRAAGHRPEARAGKPPVERVPRAPAAPGSPSSPARRWSGSRRRWVMAAELVETSRLWGRIAARIEPEWAERLAAHLVKRSYSEPHWETKQGAVMAYERVTLYGVPLVDRAQGQLRPDRPGAVPRAVHPARAGRGRLADPAPVLRREPGAAATRSRSWSTGPGGATSWSTTRPSSTSTTPRCPPSGLRRGTSTAGGSRPGGTRPTCSPSTPAMLVNSGRPASTGRLPRRVARRGLALPLTYQFEPGAAADGVTVDIPLADAQPGARGRASTGRCRGCARSW